MLLWAGLGCGGADDDPSTPYVCEQPERCDRQDNDCDGAIDEGTTLFVYRDQDKDGHGRADAEESCEAPEGYALIGDDCDDGDAQVFPGADERCDSLDEDCDGLIDEGVDQLYYLDADGDGYGDTQQPLRGCAEPAGASALGGDCDDSAAAVYPSAEELCDGEGQDEDCDGAVDEGEIQPSGWVPSVCNPLGLAPPDDGQAPFPGGALRLAAGLAVEWVGSALSVYEAETSGGPSNNSQASAQSLEIRALPVLVSGALSSVEWNGLEYSGDQDHFSFTSPLSGVVQLELTAPEGATYDLFFYDPASEALLAVEGGSAEVELFELQAYNLIVAGRAGPPGEYQLRLTEEGPDPAPVKHRAWATAATSGASLGQIYTSVSADGLTWTSLEEPSLAPEDCPGLQSALLGQPTVLEEGDIYSLWFVSQDAAGATSIGQATSWDGWSFVCGGAPVLTPSQAPAGLPGMAFPRVVVESPTALGMWMALAPECETPPCEPERVGYARSGDGLHWTDPVVQLTLGAGGCGPPITGLDVSIEGDRVVLTMGCVSGLEGVVHQVTGELRGERYDWTWADEPLMVPYEFWDGQGLLSPDVVQAPDGPQLWYLGTSLTEGPRLATALGPGAVRPATPDADGTAEIFTR